MPQVFRQPFFRPFDVLRDVKYVASNLHVQPGLWTIGLKTGEQWRPLRPHELGLAFETLPAGTLRLKTKQAIDSDPALGYICLQHDEHRGFTRHSSLVRHMAAHHEGEQGFAWVERFLRILTMALLLAIIAHDAFGLAASAYTSAVEHGLQVPS
ncbi:hypothetical protein V8E36_003510 [Tilletia maclaganii]